MIHFDEVTPFKVNLKSINGQFQTIMPHQLKTNLDKKKIAVKSCILSNGYVPLFVCAPLDLSNYFDGTTLTKKLPDGTTPTKTSTSLNYMIGLRTQVNTPGPYSYNCTYIDFKPSLNDGKAIKVQDYNYYYVYDLNKLCAYFQEQIQECCDVPTRTGVFFNYDPVTNVFVLNVDYNYILTYDIVVNKAFIGSFPFSHEKIADDLYILKFNNIMPNIINNVIYSQLTSYIPYDFVPFDSVVLTTNMNIIPFSIYTNPMTTPFEFEDSIIFSFDRMSSQLNFRDYYYVQNSYITNYSSFAFDANPGHLKFSLYLFNSRTASKILCEVGNDEFLNFEFLVCIKNLLM